MIVGTTKVFSCLFNAIDAVLHDLLKQNEEQNVKLEEKYRCCYIIGAILLCLSPAQLFKRCTEVAHKMRLWGLVGEGYSLQVFYFHLSKHDEVDDPLPRLLIRVTN